MHLASCFVRLGINCCHCCFPLTSLFVPLHLLLERIAALRLAECNNLILQQKKDVGAQKFRMRL